MSNHVSKTTLDDRIAAAFAKGASSKEVESLIPEVEAAVAVSDESAEEPALRTPTIGIADCCAHAATGQAAAPAIPAMKSRRFMGLPP